MHIYGIGMLLSSLLASLAIRNRKKFLRDRETHILHRKTGRFLLMILSVIPLAAISAVRYAVGADFFSYQYIYSTFRFETSYFEYGLRLVVLLLRQISENPQIFFVVTSFWVCIGYYIAIYQNSIDPAYSICLFVFAQEYFRSMTLVRQFMASVIVMQALSDVKKGNLKRVLFFTAIGMMFHSSAFMLIPLYFLCRIRLKPLHMFSFSLLFVVFINYVRAILLRFSSVIGRYSWYFNSMFDVANFNPYVVAIYFSFLLLCSYLYYIQRIKANDTLNLVANASFIAMILFLSRLVLPRNITRLAYYMDPVLIIYSPELFQMIKNKKLQIIIKFVAFICYMFVFFLAPDSTNQVLPYQTFWQ